MLNRHKHCIIPWLAVTLLFPVFGTAAVTAAAIILLIIQKRHDLTIPRLELSRPVIAAPAVAAIILGVSDILGLFPDIITEGLVTAGTVTAVLVIFLVRYLLLRRSTLYFRIVKRDRLSDEYETDEGLYICSHYPDDAVPDPGEAQKIIKSFRDRRCRPGPYNWQYRTEESGTEYVFDCCSNKIYTHFYDVQNAEYLGRGLTRITALDWITDRHGKIAIDPASGSAASPGSKPDFREYTSEPVKQAVLYRSAAPVLPLAAECLETAAAAFLVMSGTLFQIHASIITLF